MPVILGTFKAVSVSGVLQVGDVALIVPKTRSKSYLGSGAFNTGDLARTINLISTTNTVDTDVNDQNCQTIF